MSAFRCWLDRTLWNGAKVQQMRAREEARVAELRAEEERLRRQACALTHLLIERERGLIPEDIDRAAFASEPWGIGEIGQLAIVIGLLPEIEPRRKLAW